MGVSSNYYNFGQIKLWAVGFDVGKSSEGIFCGLNNSVKGFECIFGIVQGTLWVLSVRIGI